MFAKKRRHCADQRAQRVLDVEAGRDRGGQVGQCRGLVARGAFTAHGIDEDAQRVPAQAIRQGRARAADEQPAHTQADGQLVNQPRDPEVDQKKDADKQYDRQPGDFLRALNVLGLVRR